MYGYLALGMSVLLVGCASTGAGPDASNAPAAEPGTTVASLSHVEDVDVSAEPADTGYRCERVMPTGSRIIEERCYFEDSRRDEFERHVAREQMDYVRERQMIEQQAQHRALAEQMRRDAQRPRPAPRR